MLHFDDIVFGPIYSRRLGSSLGVNILPSKGKLCNFDCVYCECGWNKDGQDADRRFPTLDEVRDALTEKVAAAAKEGVTVDSITFSGNGEPTLHPDFAQIIDFTLKLRSEIFPQAKVSVLTNASQLGKKEVRDALMRIDNPILKIDSPIENMVLFGNNFILQTMFLKGEVDGVVIDCRNEEHCTAWRDLVRELKPREIMMYTIDRETPAQNLQKVTVEEMTAIAEPLLKEGFKIQIKG